MVSWSEFAAAAPRLAGSIRGAIHQFGPGLAFLATIRPDGKRRTRLSAGDAIAPG
jgi:hypothetical protein